MRYSHIPYNIKLAIVLVTIGIAGGGLMVQSALAKEIITIASLEYAPLCGEEFEV